MNLFLVTYKIPPPTKLVRYTVVRVTLPIFFNTSCSIAITNTVNKHFIDIFLCQKFGITRYVNNTHQKSYAYKYTPAVYLQYWQDNTSMTWNPIVSLKNYSNSIIQNLVVGQLLLLHHKVIKSKFLQINYSIFLIKI